MSEEPVEYGVKDSIHNPNKNRFNPLQETNALEEAMEINERIDPISTRAIRGNQITIRNFTYTAPPADNFPSPQITVPATQGLDANLAESFGSIPGLKLWVRPWDMTFSPDLQNARSAIAKTLQHFLDRGSQIDLLQPDVPKDSKPEPGGTPWHFLVINLSQEEYDLAVNTRVIASKLAVLFVLPYDQPIPNFVMLLKGITYEEEQIDSSTKRVEQAIRKTLKSTTSLNRDLMGLVQNSSLAGYELDRFIADITVPLPVSLINTKTNATVLQATLITISDSKGDRHVWKISSDYMPTFTSIHTYNKFIVRLLDLNYQTTGFGTGEPATGPEKYGCTGCKSRDHIKVDCPFPLIDGWITAETEMPWNEGNKRGGAPSARGRGRGRGRMTYRGNPLPRRF